MKRADVQAAGGALPKGALPKSALPKRATQIWVDKSAHFAYPKVGKKVNKWL